MASVKRLATALTSGLYRAIFWSRLIATSAYAGYNFNLAIVLFGNQFLKIGVALYNHI